jgi:hypothetical protein
MAELWCVHVEGPDDIFPMPSKEEAEKEAAEINAVAAREFEDHGDDIMFRAVVVIYPYSAESHAEGCAERAEEEALRKLQPGTLRLMFKDLHDALASRDKEIERLTAMVARSQQEGRTEALNAVFQINGPSRAITQLKKKWGIDQ